VEFKLEISMACRFVDINQVWVEFDVIDYSFNFFVILKVDVDFKKAVSYF